MGTLQFSDGRKYTGRFKNGVADGSGEEKVRLLEVAEMLKSICVEV